MIKLNKLGVSCIAGCIALVSCSSDDEAFNPWSEPQTVNQSAEIKASKISSSNSNIAVIWHEVETESRVDQVLNDAHNPSVPYNESDPISADRDMDPGDPVEPYDNTNLQHRTDAKLIDYANHPVHTHLDIYSRYNIKSQIYNSATGSWLDPVNLQTGFWKKTHRAERTIDELSNETVKITGAFPSEYFTRADIATNANGDAIAAWLQFDESGDTAGDAGEDISINVAHYSRASGWSAASTVTLATSENLMSQSLSLTVDSSGDGQLLFLARDFPDSPTSSSHPINVYRVSFDNSTDTWSAATLLSDSTSSVNMAKVYKKSGTSGVALWTQNNPAAGAAGDEAQFSLYASWFNDSGWLAAPVLISNGQGNVENFSANINDSTGELWASWSQNNSTAGADFDAVRQFSSVWVSEFSGEIESGINVGSWSTPVELQADLAATSGFDESTEHASKSDLAIDDAGNVMAVWLQEKVVSRNEPESNSWNTSNIQNVWGRTYDSTTDTWSDVVLLASDSRFSSDNPKVIALSENNFTVVWQRWDASHQGSGHFVFGLDYDASTNTTGVSYSANEATSAISSLHAFSSGSNEITVVWSADDSAIFTARK